MTDTMLAARMHHVAEEMRLEQIPVPSLGGPGEVRVRVHAVNIVPNLANILRMWTTWFPQDPLPTLPAIFGLDPRRRNRSDRGGRGCWAGTSATGSTSIPAATAWRVGPAARGGT